MIFFSKSVKLEFETKIFDAFRKFWPETFFSGDGWRIEAEAFLSGTGLPFLYQAVCHVLDEQIIAKDARIMGEKHYATSIEGIQMRMLAASACLILLMVIMR